MENEEAIPWGIVNRGDGTWDLTGMDESGGRGTFGDLQEAILAAAAPVLLQACIDVAECLRHPNGSTERKAMRQQLIDAIYLATSND